MTTTAGNLNSPGEAAYLRRIPCLVTYIISSGVEFNLFFFDGRNVESGPSEGVYRSYFRTLVHITHYIGS